MPRTSNLRQIRSRILVVQHDPQTNSTAGTGEEKGAAAESGGWDAGRPSVHRRCRGACTRYCAFRSKKAIKLMISHAKCDIITDMPYLAFDKIHGLRVTSVHWGMYANDTLFRVQKTIPSFLVSMCWAPPLVSSIAYTALCTAASYRRKPIIQACMPNE